MLINPFEENYEPEVLKHRDSELEKLRKMFDTFRKKGITRNVFVRGMPGTGKTVTMRVLLRSRDPSEYLFVSGSETRTPVRTLQALADSPSRTAYRLLPQIKDTFRYRKRIIIIDEIDKISKYDELFKDLNSLYRSVRIPIIIISNRLMLLETIPVDAKQTLFFEIHDFEQYNALQLGDIVRDRLRILDKKTQASIPGEAVQYICATEVAKGDASARTVLQVVESCLMRNNWDFTGIDDSLDDLRAYSWRSFYHKLGHTEKTFLKALLDLYLMNDGKPIKPAEIARQLPELTAQRISGLITHFEEQLVVTTKLVSKGRYGRFRLVSFQTPETFEQLYGVVRGEDPGEQLPGAASGAGKDQFLTFAP